MKYYCVIFAIILIICLFIPGCLALYIPPGGHVIVSYDTSDNSEFQDDSYVPVPTANVTAMAGSASVNILLNQSLLVLLDEDQSSGHTWDATLSNGLKLVDDKHVQALDRYTDAILEKGSHYWLIEPKESGLQTFYGIYTQGSNQTITSPTTYSLDIIVNMIDEENISESTIDELSPESNLDVKEESSKYETGVGKSSTNETLDIMEQNENSLPSLIKSHTLSKYFNEYNGKASDFTDKFFSTEDKVISTIHFNNLTSDFKIKWLWYDPNGNLDGTWEEEVEVGDEWVYSYKLLKNSKSVLMPGVWRVDLLLNGVVIDSKNFTIEISNIPLSSGINTNPVIYNIGTPIQNKDCPGITECGNNCCGPSEGCCYTANGPVCYDPSSHICSKI